MRWFPLLMLVGCAFNTPLKGVDQRSEAICALAFECFTSYPENAEFDFFELYGDSVPQCAANLGPADAEAFEAAAEDGAVVYDRDAAKDCVEVLEELSCETFFSEPLPDPCYDVIAGTLDYGERCALDEVCVSGWCRDGVCAPPG
ncbi:MAG: hypothetical protein EA397_07230 [Deltaproteobacteria bacterium]|nr:MAG: hypothetical protein EA397_07230 [Deltaproteobacteria bacterium]